MLLYKDIVKEGNEVLRLKAQEVKFPLDEETLNELELMDEYLRNSYDPKFEGNKDIRPGVGIAAPQIGVSKQMFAIMAYDEAGNFHHYIVVNPKIVSHSEEKVYLPDGEGCLSVDRKCEGLIHRAKRIKAKAIVYDFEKEEFVQTELKLQNYIAIVFQHEYDHLKGTLFVDHINQADPFKVVENSKPIKF